jgi:hypothetical protein
MLKHSYRIPVLLALAGLAACGAGNVSPVAPYARQAVSHAAAAGNPCLQARKRGPAPSVADADFSTFTTAVTNGRRICFSAYVFTDDAFYALESAATNGAKVTVVLPLEEQAEDGARAAQLAQGGATIVWDDGSSTPPLHATLAIVDGVAFLDGRNWDDGDVVITDGNPADFSAVENALNLHPTSSKNLDTLKSAALAREAAFLSGVKIRKGVAIRFMSESFGTDSDLVSALESAAKAGAGVQAIVLGSYVSGNSPEIAALDALKAAGVSVRLNPASGSEKMLLAGNLHRAWFGSANATSYGQQWDNYIDWGLNVTAKPVLGKLDAYFTSVWKSSAPY